MTSEISRHLADPRTVGASPPSYITADMFWHAFRRAVGKVLPKGYSADWTRDMYGALHLVQQDFGLYCNCRIHDKASRDGQRNELLQIDFMWFPLKPVGLPDDEQNWVPALVAIEHENSGTALDPSVDHWKVNQVAVPLRVFIGYTALPHQMEAAANQLMLREARWYPVPFGESLVIFGHDEMEHDQFLGWSARQGSSDWRRLE